uniref:Condensin-2 complex subunit D3 n=1 Tax=Tanacetum cinerariifolium TaxID=118510 RepID=A0A699IMG6_TANCI|nr:condensin-2 complex subunit D3 [Tanacetum cinerariifolium]
MESGGPQHSLLASKCSIPLHPHGLLRTICCAFKNRRWGPPLGKKKRGGGGRGKNKGKPQLRLFDNVIRQSFRGQFRKWVSEFLGIQVSTSISRKMFRCNRARAITNLAQLIGFLSGKDENKIGLMKVMGFGEEGGINDFFRKRCVDEKAAVRKAALVLISKLTTFQGDQHL